MAFNPLRIMRKHMKVMMAALVFICMVTFILSSGIGGGGDFFDWLRTTFAGGQGRNDEVATIYGERIDQQEYRRLRNQREVAHAYMKLANEQATRQAEDKLSQLRKETKTKTGVPGSFEEQMNLQARVMQLRQRHPGDYDHYFGGGVSPDGIFDFIIWRKQADRLGIQLTPDDVRRERDQETIEPLSDQAKKMIERSLASRGEYKLNAALLATALTDEFRVRLVKSALLGPDAPRTQSSPFDMGGTGRLQTSFTPHEYWEFYRKSLALISVRLLPIPVRELLPQVKVEPTDKELADLFDKYKDDEPNPALPTPGFKQPRRIQVDWVSGNANEAPYPRAAEISLAVLEATMPAVFHDQLLTEYNRQKFRFRLAGWGEQQSARALLPALKQPEYDTASRLRGLGLHPASSSMLSAVLGSFQAREVTHDLKDLGAWIEEETKIRQQFLATTLALAGVPCPPLMLAGVPALGVAARKHAGDAFGQHLPLHAVKRYLFKSMRDSTASNLLRGNLDTLRKELEKYRGRSEEARKYVAEAALRFGLKTGGMQQPRDQFSVFDDPGMQAPREGIKSYSALMGQAQGFRDMARLLDEDVKGRILSRQIFAMLSKTYAPQTTFGGEATYLYWATLDKAAYVPKFEEVKDQVVEAWRLQKARALAKAEAEKIAEAARKAGNDAGRILVDGSPFSGKLIDLYGVTRLKPPEQSALPGRDRQYTPYQLPASEIEFPTLDFRDKLLELKGLGEVVVLNDHPEAIYYVATPLSARVEPSRDAFYDIYRRSAPGFLADPLVKHFDLERRAEQQEAVMKQLRAEAKLKRNEEIIKAVLEPRQ